jgi:hypothetical protein
VLDKQPGHDIYNIYAHKAKYHELWVFNHLTLTWGTAALPGMPLTGMMGKSKKSKDGGSGALYEDAIYALKGGNTQEFWKCTLPAATWSERETIPAFGSTGKKKRVKGGGDIAAFGDGLFFALKGNKTLEMWRYSLGAVAAATPQRSGVMADRTAGPAGVAVASPARTSALVSFSLPQAGSVRITLIDVSGRTVAQRTIAAGRSGQTALDLRQLSAGVYLVRFDAAGFSATRKLVVE